MYPTLIDTGTMFEVSDDFFNLDTVKWTSVDDAGTGTNTANAVAGGEVSIVTAAADNDYHLMASAAKVFKFAANKPLFFRARFTLTEANTDDSNIIMGVSSITTSGQLANDGAGPAGTYDGAVFFKVDGTMTLQFETSAATAQVTQTVTTFTSGTTYQVGFSFNPNDGTTGIVTPWVYNETTAVKTDGTPHSIALASLGTMFLIYGVKAGGANAETLKMDYINCAAKR